MTTKTSDSDVADHAHARKKLTLDNVGELKAVLAEVEPKPHHSSKDAVAEMLPLVGELQEKGYTILDICDMINDQGFDMPLSTFRSYLAKGGYRRNRRRNSTQSKSSTPVERQPAPSKPSQTEVSGAGQFAIEDDKQV